MTRNLFISLCTGGLLASGATAQEIALPEVSVISRTFELPAQRRLSDRIARPDAELAPFVTDGCSGGLSAGWQLAAQILPGFVEAHDDEPPWQHCCVIHDRAYHDASGETDPERSLTARLTADMALKTCVAAQAVAEDTAFSETLRSTYNLSADQIARTYDLIAVTMFQAVRVGGLPCSGLPWRWGYGWPACHALSD